MFEEGLISVGLFNVSFCFDVVELHLNLQRPTYIPNAVIVELVEHLIRDAHQLISRPGRCISSFHA